MRSVTLRSLRTVSRPSRFATREELQSEAGHTLVELMASMLIFSVVMAGLYSAHVTQAKAYFTEQQLSDAQQTVRVIQSMVAQDVQRAGYNPTNASFAGLTYNPASLQILADLDADSATTGPNENVVYTYDGGQFRLVRGIGVAQVAFPNIQAFTYTYLDAGGAPTTVSSAIRQVRVSVTVRTAQPDPDYPSNGGYRTVEADFRVAARNLSL